MRLLDLFCGAGGAAMGYHRAGFEVVGVDIKPQPRYPFAFFQADALMVPVIGFDAVHASPPCQRYTIAQNARKNAAAHPDLVAPTREVLRRSGLPYVIENVVGAPLVNPVTLCGTAFGLEHDGFELRRHRLFECSFPVLTVPCRHRLPAAPVFGHNAGRDFYRRHGRGYNAAAKAAIMEIDWMTRDEVSQAIPPVFTELIGRFLLADAALGVIA
jgi:DNA (cytosine-5)-methyltransferase 1